MDSSFQLFTVRGIAIRVHITFPLILIWSMLQFGWLAGLGLGGALFGLVVTLLLFGIVVLHELGHSIAAQNYGIPVNQIVLLPIGGVASLSRIPEKPIQELVIAIAGPAVNLVIAVILFVLSQLTGLGSGVDSAAALTTGIRSISPDAIFSVIFSANLFLALFNLIPAFPMDGGRVLRALLASRIDYVRATSIAVAIGQGIAWLMGLWGFLNGNFLLIIVAIFIYLGAGYEGQTIQTRRVLGNIRVDQAYSRQARTLSPDAPLQEAINLTLSTFQSDFPVCDGTRLVGLLPYRNLVEALVQGTEARVSTVMLTEIAPVAPGDSLFDAQRRMQELQVDALPVADGGQFLGLLTSRDVGEVYRLASVRPDLLSRLQGGTISTAGQV